MKVITKIKLNDFREQTDDMTSVTIGYWEKKFTNKSQRKPTCFNRGSMSELPI